MNERYLKVDIVKVDGGGSVMEMMRGICQTRYGMDTDMLSIWISPYVDVITRKIAFIECIAICKAFCPKSNVNDRHLVCSFVSHL
jgi:hypothetical protein